ncbi:MAG TPA: T9SS type A sorting domain-containing protein [Saprospiraceae bacterium]|nr:T9SS type A sorting domain-containing protein [Saprospiraceae bacterium]
MLVATSLFLSGQTLLNGDFEVNKASDCTYNLEDRDFNRHFSGVRAFGKKYIFSRKYVGESDIQTHGCYVTPQSGDWCVGIGSDTTTDAIALSLSAKLVPGKSYRLDFYVFGNTTFVSSLATLMIGSSTNDSTFGEFIDSVAPESMNWKAATMQFTAINDGSYITVKNARQRGWNQVDHFVIQEVTGSEQESYSKPLLFPNPATDNVRILLKEPGQKLSVKVYNTMGILLHQSEEQQIDLSEFPPGMYLVEVHTQNGKWLSRLQKI